MNPINKIKEHNSSNNLEFNEEQHKYTLDGVRLDSVTTKLGAFFPFDRDKIAEKVAGYRGVTKEEIISAWEETAVYGTHIHLLAEKYILGEHLNPQELEEIKHAIAFFNDNPHFEVLGTEVKIFSKKHKIAGTVDLMVKHKETGNIHLLDYKTCGKDIIKNECYQMALGPLKEFPHNKFFSYSM